MGQREWLCLRVASQHRPSAASQLIHRAAGRLPIGLRELPHFDLLVDTRAEEGVARAEAHGSTWLGVIPKEAAFVEGGNLRTAVMVSWPPEDARLTEDRDLLPTPLTSQSFSALSLQATTRIALPSASEQMHIALTADGCRTRSVTRWVYTVCMPCAMS